MNPGRCAFVLLLAVAGCAKDPTGPSNEGVPSIPNGVFVLNEGAFGDPAGARLSAFDLTNAIVYRDLFEAGSGGAHLGSVGDDMVFLRGKAYCVMSGSENIAVVSLSDFSLVQSRSLPGDTPHDLFIDSTAGRLYVTRLFRNSVLVLDLATLTTIDSITVGTNPLGMCLHGNILYVCNSGYGADNRVSLVDIRGDTVMATSFVGDGPSGVALAPDGRVWVACTGNAFGSPPTNGRIAIINASTGTVEDSILFPTTLSGGMTMSTDGFAYVVGVSAGSFSGGPVHRVNTMTHAVTQDFISGTFYAIAVDNATSTILVSNAMNFTADGQVRIYTNAGALVTQFGTQLIPGVILVRHG